MNKKMLAKEVFWDIRRKVLARFPDIPHIKFEPCYTADEDHKKSPRVYCHWGHKSGVICFAKAFLDLPVDNKRGILLHEFGHVLDDEYEPYEDEEDENLDKIDQEQDEEIRADLFVVTYLEQNYGYDKDNIQTVTRTNPFVDRRLAGKAK